MNTPTGSQTCPPRETLRRPTGRSGIRRTAFVDCAERDPAILTVSTRGSYELWRAESSRKCTWRSLRRSTGRRSTARFSFKRNDHGGKPRPGKISVYREPAMAMSFDYRALEGGQGRGGSAVSIIASRTGASTTASSLRPSTTATCLCCREATGTDQEGLPLTEWRPSSGRCPNSISGCLQRMPATTSQSNNAAPPRRLAA